MSPRALDVFFRHKFLVLFPLVILVIAGSAAAATRQSTEYESQAKVWTQRTPLFDSRLGGDDPWSTPAQYRTRVMGELLHLDSFTLQVADRVEALDGVPDIQRLALIREGTAIFPAGEHIVVVSHRSDDPVLAQAVVTEVIRYYSETFLEGIIDEAGIAQEFYEGQLEQVRARLENEQQTYNEQRAINPEGESSGALSAAEVRLERAQDDYQQVLGRLEEIHLQRETALGGKDLSFRVSDEPTLPDATIPLSRRDLAMFPLFGLVLGVAASGATLFTLTRVDNSIRRPPELRDLGVPVLGVIPDIGRQKSTAWPEHFVRKVVALTRGMASG